MDPEKYEKIKLEKNVVKQGFFVQSEPSSGPNFGLTQPNFALTQQNFGLTQPNSPLTQNFGRKMVKIDALTQKNRQNRSKFGSNSAPKMVQLKIPD